MEGRPVLWILLLMICLPHLLGLEGLAEDILKEVNELREEVGLPPLKLDERLSGKAYEYLNAFLNGNTPQIVYNCALLMITLPKNHTFSSRFVAGLLLRKGAGSARFKTAGLAVVTTHAGQRGKFYRPPTEADLQAYRAAEKALAAKD